jgi:multiple sugar transport system ATP-binding protein
MRDGRVQQVDIPQRLYENPVNLFVAAFIGSPAMNLIETSLGGNAVSLAGHSIPLDTGRLPRAADAGHTILGIRPEAFEDAEFAPRGLPQIEVRVEVVEELGSDAFVFFPIEAEGVVVEDALTDGSGDETTLLAAERDRTLFAARVDPRTRAKVGETIRLAVDPSRFYFFSPLTSESLLERAA